MGLKAIGITCGMGSMLIGARKAGFKILGNIEWRKYYHTDTFVKNFKGAYMVKQYGENPPISPYEIDIAFGHPECGNFSNMRANKTNMINDPGDIPLFYEMVNKIKPKFFVMDNLPKSLIGFPVKEYIKVLKDYDVFFEYISNYNYGNTQKNRKRYFAIGALKDLKYVFVPGEFEHDKKLIDVIGDLPARKDIYEINHVHRKDSSVIPGWRSYQFALKGPNRALTLGEFKQCVKDHPVRKNFYYLNKKGEEKQKIGYNKIILDHYSPVMSGGGGVFDNHYRFDTLNPLTIRERARIQGCPDDFIFYPLDYMKSNSLYLAVYKQTGKFMPVEFNEYIARQIKNFLEKKEPRKKYTGQRLINSHPCIDEAKKYYCKNVGYSSKIVCGFCWMRDNCEVKK